MRRHLYLQIYAAFLVVATLSFALAGAVAQLTFDSRRPPEPLAPVVKLIAAEIDENVDSIQTVGTRLHLDLTLWSSELHLLGHAGDPLTPPDVRGPDAQWLGFPDGPGAVVRLDDGRWLAVHARWSWNPGHFFVGLVVLLLATSILTYPVARRITRRLERLGAVVERWGRGELGARFRGHGRDEVATLARGFNRAADRVQSLLDGQRAMLASASHELRSPLARLRMSVELLDDGTPERSRLAQQAVQDIEELDALVGDLLLTSRLQARPEPGPRETVDLTRLVAEEAERVAATVRGPSVPVSADPRMLRRALRNLLENARRHGGAGPIEVEVSDANPVRVTVSDRGPGVPEADRARIFEPFYRASGHAEGRDGGVGLGLALVREIVVHHGGRVACGARVGGGSVFTVELPNLNQG